MCLFFSFFFAAGAERRESLWLCECGERQLLCVPGRVCAGVYRNAFTAMETSAWPDCLGHTPHYGLHLHLQRPHHPALGPGNLTSQQSSDLGHIFVASDFYNMIFQAM